MNYFNSHAPFKLESGEELSGITIAYHIYGQLNASAENVIWICHALTASSDAKAWWPGMIGDNAVFDTAKYCVICANMPGSCYGSTGPLSTDPSTAETYFKQFPLITIRDMVRAYQLLRVHLGIKSIKLMAGGSMGGYQALEWSVMEPALIQKLFLIACSPKESPWGIAIHTAQRMAIEADQSFGEPSAEAGKNGLKVARAFGMVNYRTYQSYELTQSETDNDKSDHFRASSYITYQGLKLVNRFNAYSYWYLTKAMDSHNISRNRNKSVEEVLSSINQKTLVMGISSDLLCPVSEQQHMAQYIINAGYIEIESVFGHDGFLIETETIAKHLSLWLDKE